MTNDGANTLAYDAENRTLSATNGTTSGTYTYDGHNFRVTRVTGGQTFVYIFSGSKVIAEYVNGVAPSSPTREYVYSGSTLLAKIESGATRYYHQDQLSNRLVTNSAGAVTEQMGHYPYGESWYSTLVDKLFFTSYDRDSESGNDYAMARFYVNRLGRFSLPDPAGVEAADPTDPQSWNQYAYVANNPLGFVDPSGRFKKIGADGCVYEGVDYYVDGTYGGTDYYLVSCDASGGGEGGGSGPTGGGGGGKIGPTTPPPHDPRCPGNLRSSLITSFVASIPAFQAARVVATTTNHTISVGYDANLVLAFGTFGGSVHAGDALAFDPKGNIALISTTGAGGGFGGDTGFTAQIGFMRTPSVLELNSGSTITSMVGGGNGLAGAVGSDLEGNLILQAGAGEGIGTSATYDVAQEKIVACVP